VVTEVFILGDYSTIEDATATDELPQRKLLENFNLATKK
jgi:hypothetical protein